MIPRNQFPSFQPYVTTEIMIIIQKYPVHYIQLWIVIIIIIITTEVMIIITIQLWIQKSPKKIVHFSSPPFQWISHLPNDQIQRLSRCTTRVLLGDPKSKH